MYCHKLTRSLSHAAEQYTQLGYQVGMTYGKVLVDEQYSPYRDPNKWNGISIILDGLVCVDMDRFTTLGDKFVLPTTFKERSPRGLHYFYRLPPRFRGISKIDWKKHIDLLTKARSVRYGSSGQEFQGHVLCSPSKGYTRLSIRTPRKADLPMAPDWILENLR